MKFFKHTPDRYFKITVEADLLSDDDDINEEVPISSLEQLILELELVAAELRQLLNEDDKELKAN